LSEEFKGRNVYESTSNQDVKIYDLIPEEAERLLEQLPIPYNSGAEYYLLEYIDFEETRMQPVKDFLKMLYPDMDAKDFFSLSHKESENPIDRNRGIPKGLLSKGQEVPDIKVVVADWDGTVGDYYEYIATAVDRLLEYISDTRGINRKELDKQLIQFGKDKVAECFYGPSYFSVGGAREILRSPELQSLSSKKVSAKTDENFLKYVFHPLLTEAYAHIYDDTKEFFKTLDGKGVPIYIHSDSPVSEMIDKLKYSKMATFVYDDNNNIVAVKNCMFKGISAKKRRVLNTPEEQHLVDVFKASGIDLILNTQEECKPSPAPLKKIQESLMSKGYSVIQPYEMLMVGDFMAKDGMFAANTGMYFAWPGERAIKTDKAVQVNKVTAAADVGYRNNISKQLEVLVNEMLGRDTDKMQAFADITAICKDYTTLLKYFSFKAPDKDERIKGNINSGKNSTDSESIAFVINEFVKKQHQL